MELYILNFKVFLLILVRIFAMLQVAPIFSSTAIPRIARIGFAFFIAGIIFPVILSNGYILPDNMVNYFLLIIGESLIGIIIGFFLVLIFSAFQLAGQFFSLQMGFGASQVFDPLAQVEIPLMGQFLNIIAMFVFVYIGGLYKFIFVGVMQSFQSIKAIDLVTGREFIFTLFLGSLGRLFENALTISFPMLGTLFLISTTIGLLAKAAPQMNLLMIGFPIAIGAAFLILLFCIPFLMHAFARLLDASFDGLIDLFKGIKGVGI